MKYLLLLLPTLAFANVDKQDAWMEEQTYWNTLRIQRELEQDRREREQERRREEQEEKQQMLMDSFPNRYNIDVDRW